MRSTRGCPLLMRSAALRRTSSLTGSDSHPDSRSWPRVAGRLLMRGLYAPGVRRFLAVLIAVELLTAGGVLGVREYRGTTHVIVRDNTAVSTSTTEGITVVPAA